MLEEEDGAGLEGGARGEPLPALESSLLGAQGTREAEASLLTRSCLVLRSTFLEKRLFSSRWH